MLVRSWRGFSGAFDAIGVCPWGFLSKSLGAKFSSGPLNSGESTGSSRGSP